MSNHKQSVLIIGINFFPEPTGIGKYTGEYAFWLASHGYKTDVITSPPYYPQWKVYKGYKSSWYKKEEIDGVNITRCPLYIPKSLSGGKRIMQDLSFFMSAFFSLLGKMVGGKKYDMIFVASPSFMPGFLGLFYKFFFRKAKFVYHIQDLQIDAAEELGMINSGVLLRMLKWSEGRILKGADWVTTISKGMESKIKAKHFPIKALYIFPNWVNFDSINKKDANLSAISHLGFPINKKLVFYSGAVGEKQGLEMVLDAAKFAMQQLPELFFLIAGSGPYTQVLKQKMADERISNLLFIDLQPIEVFNELLNHAFLHLVIQKDKAGDLLLPSKLTNILAVGGVAIVTASPGTSLFDIVNSNRLGIVIEPENPVAFCKALEMAYHHPGILGDFKKNAADYAANYLEKDTIISSFMNEVNFLKSSTPRKILA